MGTSNAKDRDGMSMRLAAMALLLAPVSAFMNFHQPCREFSCASSQLARVPKKDFVFTANGCGTAALPISTAIDFSECCNWHDVCYSTCGMKKATCEKRLDKCMRARCAQLESSGDTEQCEATAKLFSLGAQMVACPAYQDAQREACRCVDKHKADAAMRDRLVHFLKENGAPASDLEDATVQKLLAKYKGQEPKMFLRLLVKYPNAIKPDKRKRNFMEDMFKAAEGEQPGKRRKNVFAAGLDEENAEEEEARASEDEQRVDEHIEL